MYDCNAYLALPFCVAMIDDVLNDPAVMAVAVAASIDRTAAAMSQWAPRMRERSSDVNDFNASLT